MSEPINLNKLRKAFAKAAEQRQADANSVNFGRSKSERVLEAARNARMSRALDRHQIESEAE